MDRIEIKLRNLQDPIPLVEDRENVLTRQISHSGRILLMTERHTIGIVAADLGIFILAHS